MATELIRLVDPNGSVLIVGKLDGLVYTLGLELAGDEPFRMFEDNRAVLRGFLKPLED